MLRLTALRTLGTHSGTFHADEVLACSLLLFLNPGLQLTRTRDPSLLDQQDIVVDVGAVYDPARHRYDHHQRGFEEVLEGFRTKLSSFGLVYRHFGLEALRKLVYKPGDGETSTVNIQALYPLVYKNFVEAVDGIDNGVPIYPNQHLLVPNYNNRTSLSSIVSFLNPVDPKDADKAFREAMPLAWKCFTACVMHCADIVLPSVEAVHKAFNERLEDGKLMLLEKWCDWKEVLLEIDVKEEVLFVIYPANDMWRLQCVPVSLQGFQNRLSLPQAWRGLRDQELDGEIQGVHPGATFVHAGGFTGGHRTKAGVVEMVRLAIQQGSS